MTHYHTTYDASLMLASTPLRLHIASNEEFEQVAQIMARYSLDPAAAIERFYGLTLDGIASRMINGERVMPAI